MRILLIDDKDDFRNPLNLWLTDTLKHGVAVATSIEEAKKQLQKDRYHAILLDGRLRNTVNDRIDPTPTGGVSGLEVLRTLSATQRSKTIWMTAHHFDDLSDPALLGCNCFLFKGWMRKAHNEGPCSNQFQKKLYDHLTRISAERPTILKTILGWFAVILLATGVIWQIIEQEQSKLALFATVSGIIVNFVSFWSILVGLPVHRFLRGRRH